MMPYLWLGLIAIGCAVLGVVSYRIGSRAPTETEADVAPIPICTRCGKAVTWAIPMKLTDSNGITWVPESLCEVCRTKETR